MQELSAVALENFSRVFQVEVYLQQDKKKARAEGFFFIFLFRDQQRMGTVHSSIRIDENDRKDQVARRMEPGYFLSFAYGISN